MIATELSIAYDFVVGLAAGLVGGFLGLGGGVVLVPMFVTHLGIDVKTAVATSLSLAVVNGLIASGSHCRRGLVNPYLVSILAPAGIFGAIAGSLFTLSVPGIVVKAVFVGLLIYAFASIFFGGPRERVSSGSFEYFDEARNTTIRYGVRRPLLLGLLSFSAGVASGMLGIGGGTVYVPLMVVVGWVPIKPAIAASSYLVALTSASGALVYLAHGVVDSMLFSATAPGVLLGAAIGARAMRKTRAAIVRRIFGLVLLYYAYDMLMDVIAELTG